MDVQTLFPPGGRQGARFCSETCVTTLLPFHTRETTDSLILAQVLIPPEDFGHAIWLVGEGEGRCGVCFLFLPCC